MEKAFFFLWALLVAWHRQIKPSLPCPTLPITNQKSKGLPEGKITGETMPGKLAG